MSTTNPTEVTTQWEDQMVKRGIWAPREVEKRNEELYNERIDALESVNVFENTKLEKLDDININIDEEFENELKKIREKRIALLKNKAKENSKFGEVYHITKQDFVKEVTESSKNNNIVVVHLYKDYLSECRIINMILSEYISKKYGYIKFVKGISSDIIPNYPDKSLPVLIIYKNGTTIAQINGLSNFKDKNNFINNNSIENLLIRNKVIKLNELNEDKNDEISSDSDEDEKEYEDNKCYSSLKFDKIQERVRCLHKI
ncbi:hypothetical protein FG386_001483 [Cryptosporidium ryanae]|uniref:uncharacterized protein n=1 Tax=Cryptosporidium ryanae TaxID=515981 RepID=UPI00351A101C|nr:hypothetical protein FG386_001483 [Cryptosporidium ryanae]